MTSRKGRSKGVRGHRLGYMHSVELGDCYVDTTHQKGFNTDLQGCLHITGSNCSSGVSGFSFSGVYSAPMGTTSREASWTSLALGVSIADHNSPCASSAKHSN